MCILTIINQPVTQSYFQFNLISLEGDWARCRFPQMAARCTTVIKCLLWLADLAVVHVLSLFPILTPADVPVIIPIHPTATQQ